MKSTLVINFILWGYLCCQCISAQQVYMANNDGVGDLYENANFTTVNGSIDDNSTTHQYGAMTSNGHYYSPASTVAPIDNIDNGLASASSDTSTTDFISAMTSDLSTEATTFSMTSDQSTEAMTSDLSSEATTTSMASDQSTGPTTPSMTSDEPVELTISSITSDQSTESTISSETPDDSSQSTGPTTPSMTSDEPVELTISSITSDQSTESTISSETPDDSNQSTGPTTPSMTSDEPVELTISSITSDQSTESTISSETPDDSSQSTRPTTPSMTSDEPVELTISSITSDQSTESTISSETPDDSNQSTGPTTPSMTSDEPVELTISSITSDQSTESTISSETPDDSSQPTISSETPDDSSQPTISSETPDDSSQSTLSAVTPDESNPSTITADTDTPTSDAQTTSTVPTTRLTTPVPTAPPVMEPDLDDATFAFDLSIQFDAPYEDCCANEDTDEYLQLKEEVATTLTTAYEVEFPDDLELIDVTGFSLSGGARVHDASIQQDKTVANYDAVFKAALLDDDLDASVDSVVSRITNKVFPELHDASFGNYSVDAGYLNTTAVGELEDEGRSLGGNLCQQLGSVCPFAYTCEVTVTDQKSDINCRYACQTATCDELSNSKCVVNNVGTSECKCEAKHVEFPGSCVHENYLIGLFAGVGGAIVLSLVIATTVLACKNKNHKESKNTSQMPQDSEAFMNELYGDEHREPLMMDGATTAETKFDTFGKNDAPDGGGVGKDEDQSSGWGSQEPNEPDDDSEDEEDMQQDAGNEGYDNASYAAETLWSASNVPGGMSDKDKKQYEAYYKKLEQSNTVRNFLPNLSHIDTSKTYFKAPTVNIRSDD